MMLKNTCKLFVTRIYRILDSWPDRYNGREVLTNDGLCE